MKWILRYLLVAFCACAGMAGAAQAQGQAKMKIGPIGQKIADDLNQTRATITNAVTTKLAPKAALPCMDITVLTKLTVANLMPTIKGCEQDGIKQLVSDSSRALASAVAYVGPNGGAPGDGDGIACHKPALELWKAALIVPATPGSPAVDAVAAVLNPDGSVKTPAIAAVPAVPATPELDPGPILIGQKFSEFVKSGGITSCKTWINNQINAVASAAAGAVRDVVAAAILLAPQ